MNSLLEPSRIHRLTLLLSISAKLPGQRHTRLRRALSQDPCLRIINVRGTGYKLIAE